MTDQEIHDKAVALFLEQMDRDARAMRALDRSPAGRMMSNAALRMGRVPKDYKPLGVAVRKDK